MPKSRSPSNFVRAAAVGGSFTDRGRMDGIGSDTVEETPPTGDVGSDLFDGCDAAAGEIGDRPGTGRVDNPILDQLTVDTNGVTVGTDGGV